jgi:hypothetical protein
LGKFASANFPFISLEKSVPMISPGTRLAAGFMKLTAASLPETSGKGFIESIEIIMKEIFE